MWLIAECKQTFKVSIHQSDHNPQSCAFAAPSFMVTSQSICFCLDLVSFK